MEDILNLLKESKIVKKILSKEFDSVENCYTLKIRVELINSWNLQIFEHKKGNLRRYAYHVFKGDELIIRWDNAPHFRKMKTFPNHKHTKEGVFESEEINIREMLEELEEMVI